MCSIGVLSKVIGLAAMIKGYGKLHYWNNWITVDVDDELVRYYRSLIPKYYYVKPPKYSPHITVVRLGVEQVQSSYMKLWNKYSDEIIDFEYIPKVKHSGLYFYLDVYSRRIGEIRQELGLPIFRHNFFCYHLTIGNIK